MRLTIVSFDGLALNNASYVAEFPDGEDSFFNLPAVDVHELKPAGTWPELTNVTRQAKNFVIGVECKGAFAAQLDTLKGTFDTKKQGLKKLLLVDDSAKQWHVMCKCVRHPVLDVSYSEFQMYAPDFTLRSEIEASATQTVTTSGQTWNVTPGGNDTEIKPRITVTPKNALTGGYAYKMYRPIINPIDVAFRDYPFDVTNASLNTATLVSGGKMQADGDDYRVLIGGVEVDRWLSGMNGANTKTWVNINLAPKIQLTLNGALTNVQAVTELNFKKTTANKLALKKLPQGGGTLIRGGEAFIYTAVNVEKLKLTGVTRGANGTTQVAHSDGATFDWVQWDCWLLYGNSSAIAPEVDDTRKPIIDLDNSTNTSWVYAVFADVAGLRTAAWQPKVSKGSHTVTYGGNQGADDQDPYTEMGMAIRAYQTASGWRAEDGTARWGLYHPAGITHVTASGEIRRMATNWPLARLNKSRNGTNWSTQYTLAQPASAGAFAAWTKSSEALGNTYSYLEFLFDGVVKGSVSNEADFEVESVTLTIDSTRIPTIVSITEAANYHLDGVLTNNLTGKQLPVRWTMKLNETLVIDTLNRTVTYNGSVNALSALGEFNRVDWFDLTGGVANQLQWDQTGTQSVEFKIEYRDAYV